MNKKAQFGFIRVLFVALAFIIVFALALAPIVSTAIGVSLDTGNVTGFEAFLLGGLNIWILIGFVLFVIAALIWGLNTQ
jgi:hypothetical protein